MSLPSPSSTAANPDTSRVHAFILAGGHGARLQGLTAVRAKPAVAFAGSLRMIDFTLSNCLNSGLTQVSVLTQYRSESVERHLEGGWWRVAADGGEVRVLRAARAGGYRGTADAVHQHLDRLRRQGVRQLVVLAGDHVCKMDLRALLRTHARLGAGLTVAAVDVPLADAHAFGVLRSNAFGQVIDFEEKPARPLAIPGRDDRALASMGIYAASIDVLDRLLARDADDPASCHDFGHDILPRALADGLLAVHHFDAGCVRAAGQAVYWRDVGTVDAYWQAHRDLTAASPAIDLFDPDWPLHTRPLPLLPSQVAAQGDGAAGGGLSGSLISGGCRIDAATVRGSVLSPGVRVGAGSVVDESVLLPGVVVGRRTVLRRVIVDEGCTLPDGLQVGVHPDEDRARFHVTAAGITLISAPMLDAGRAPSRPRPAARAVRQPEVPHATGEPPWSPWQTQFQ